MFAEQIVLELPEWLMKMPTPVWVGLGILVWYFVVGFSMRFLERDPCGDVYIPLTAVEIPPFILWLFHPLILFIVVGVYIAWLLAWVVSCGTVPSPWWWTR